MSNDEIIKKTETGWETTWAGEPVRLVEVPGSDPWFVAADVAVGLDVRDAEHATRPVPEDMKGTRVVGTPGGPQEMTVLSFDGVIWASLAARPKDPERRARIDAFKRFCVSLAARVMKGELVPLPAGQAVAFPPELLAVFKAIAQSARPRTPEPEQQRALDVLRIDGPMRAAALAEKLGCSEIAASHLLGELRALSLVGCRRGEWHAWKEPTTPAVKSPSTYRKDKKAAILAYITANPWQSKRMITAAVKGSRDIISDLVDELAGENLVRLMGSGPRAGWVRAATQLDITDAKKGGQ